MINALTIVPEYHSGVWDGLFNSLHVSRADFTVTSSVVWSSFVSVGWCPSWLPECWHEPALTVVRDKDSLMFNSRDEILIFKLSWRPFLSFNVTPHCWLHAASCFSAIITERTSWCVSVLIGQACFSNRIKLCSLMGKKNTVPQQRKNMW